MSNIKLKNASGVETTYNNVKKIIIPKSDGSGNAEFNEGTPFETGIGCFVHLYVSSSLGYSLSGTVNINFYGTNNSSPNPDSDTIIKSKTFTYDLDGGEQKEEKFFMSSDEILSNSYTFVYCAVTSPDMQTSKSDFQNSNVWINKDLYFDTSACSTSCIPWYRSGSNDDVSSRRVALQPFAMIKTTNGWHSGMTFMINKNNFSKGLLINHYIIEWSD